MEKKPKTVGYCYGCGQNIPLTDDMTIIPEGCHCARKMYADKLKAQKES